MLHYVDPKEFTSLSITLFTRIFSSWKWKQQSIPEAHEIEYSVTQKLQRSVWHSLNRVLAVHCASLLILWSIFVLNFLFQILFSRTQKCEVNNHSSISLTTLKFNWKIEFEQLFTRKILFSLNKVNTAGRGASKESFIPIWFPLLRINLFQQQSTSEKVFFFFNHRWIYCTWVYRKLMSLSSSEK